MNLTTLLKNVFDYEHWVDPYLQIGAVKELGLEHFWPITSASTDEALREEHRAPSFWRARPANTQHP